MKTCEERSIAAPQPNLVFMAVVVLIVPWIELLWLILAWRP